MGNDGGQFDIFQVSAVDPPLRDNRDCMEFPFLGLQKRRTKPIEFEQGGVFVEVYAPPKFGIASVWDWDVMIFCASHVNEAIENRRKISPEISFAPHDCLKQIGRGTGGKDYKELAQAIRRLSATMVVTNIREIDQPERGEERGFRWLNSYSLPKRYGRRVHTTPDNITHITPRDPDGDPDPARPWVIELPRWIYNAIVRQGDILAVHSGYFQLTGGIERWLYRLARKAVPDKADAPVIKFKMENLHARSGVTRDLRHFACDIRKIAEKQPLPEYGVEIEYRKKQSELVSLYRDKAKPGRPPRGRRLKTIKGEPIKPVVTVEPPLDEEPPLPIACELVPQITDGSPVVGAFCTLVQDPDVTHAINSLQSQPTEPLILSEKEVARSSQTPCFGSTSGAGEAQFVCPFRAMRVSSKKSAGCSGRPGTRPTSPTSLLAAMRTSSLGTKSTRVSPSPADRGRRNRFCNGCTNERDDPGPSHARPSGAGV